MQGVLDMMTTGKLDKVAELSQLDILSILYAAIIHDFKHPGMNNGFLINSKSEIAIQFNGKLKNINCIYKINHALRIII